MPAIRILPDRVANQIAAGEVIERPVAVIKELVENSIDAGATRIEVEFRNGGKSYIRVSDNGAGMSPDEALMALERHATSKIREAADLNEVRSFGFRGEALPSIAAVSRFTLRTRTEGWEHGTEIYINGGKLVHKKECGMPVGTVIEVANLFNSVPARRKFLKTDPTETAHITYTSRLFAVANPSVAFRVIDGSRQVFQSPSCDNLRDRIAEIWGRGLADDLIPVDATDATTGYRLTGLTAKPGVGRSTRRELITLVNRRAVDSRTLGFAVLDAYMGRIQKGRYPPAFLFLDVPPVEVDVNVHPAKREVRFRNDGQVRRFVLGAVSDTLAAHAKPVSATAHAEAGHDTPPSDGPAPRPSLAPTPERRASTPPKPQTAAPQTLSPSLPSVETRHAVEPPATESPKRSEWTFLQLVRRRYALFETARGLLMLHLRHADQRVRFERILAEREKDEPASQQLLVPIPIELEPLAAEALESELALLNRNGFAVEAFGRNFYRMMAIPEWLELERAEDFLRDLVDRFRQRGGSRKNDRFVWESVARLAIEQSYRRSDPSTRESVEALARELMHCDTPHTSPEGKPTFSEISWSEWERRFGN